MSLTETSSYFIRGVLEYTGKSRWRRPGFGTWGTEIRFVASARRLDGLRLSRLRIYDVVEQDRSGSGNVRGVKKVAVLQSLNQTSGRYLASSIESRIPCCSSYPLLWSITESVWRVCRAQG